MVRDFAALEPEHLEGDIRRTGFFRNKSKSIVGAARKLLSDFGGKAPDEMDSSRITGSRDRCTAAPVAILRAFS
jgi:endonuclease III